MNNYFQHSFKQRYIHCDFDGRAFVRSCAPGTFWNQDVLTCTPENFIFPQNNTLKSFVSSNSDAVSSYGNNYLQPSPTPSASSSYTGGYQQQQQPISQTIIAQGYGSYQQPEVTTQGNSRF